MPRIALIAASVVGGLLVLLVAAILIVPQMVPSDVYRERIETAATSALGRDVSVTGDIRLRVFPRIEARAGSTTIANPEGFGDAPFASMGELRAAVKLIPLLFQRVEVDEFVLVEPRIGLVAREDGSNNWTFESSAADTPPPAQGGGALSASLGDVRIIDGQVDYEDRASGQAHTVSGLQMRARMDAIDTPFDITAEGVADQLPFDLSAMISNPKALMDGDPSNITAELNTDLVVADLEGSLTLGATPQFDFGFEGEVPAITELASRFAVAGLPPADVLGSISATGRASGTFDNIRLELARGTHTSLLVNAELSGAITLSDSIAFELETNADIPQLADLATAMSIEAPASGVLGRANATARIVGAPGDIRFENVSLTHDSALLKMNYAGGARLADSLTYSGRLAIDAPDLKRLAAATGAQLPSGDVYRRFSLSGETSGGATDLLLRDAVVEFDDIRGTGRAALDFAGKPRLTGSLNTGPIDVTPYAATSGAPPAQSTPRQGWGSTPIDLSPLRLADAEISLDADQLKYRQFDFGPSNIRLALSDGRLNARVDQTTLFGGVGGLQLVADGSGELPIVGIKADIDGLAVQPFLQAAANFGLMEGTGDLTVDITGTGGTLSSFMSSLQGQGGLAFDEGTLNGVDLNLLASSAGTALSSRSIPGSAFGSSASTAFRNLAANFSMQDGVAAIANMKFQTGTVAVSGGGSLDVGNQAVSFTLFPEFADSSSGVNGYGLPVKFQGDWNGVQASVDFDWLVQRATADARTRVQAEIRNELEEQLGDNFSGLFGSRQSTPVAAPAEPSSGAQTSQDDANAGEAAPTSEAPPAEPAQQRETPEELLRREAGRALGDLFRGDNN